MQCDWSKSFSIATQELDFSQPYDILQIPKGNYAVPFKTKKSHRWTNCFFFSKFVLTTCFRAFWACQAKRKENYMIKL